MSSTFFLVFKWTKQTHIWLWLCQILSLQTSLGIEFSFSESNTSTNNVTPTHKFLNVALHGSYNCQQKAKEQLKHKRVGDQQKCQDRTTTAVWEGKEGCLGWEVFFLMIPMPKGGRGHSSWGNRSEPSYMSSVPGSVIHSQMLNTHLYIHSFHFCKIWNILIGSFQKLVKMEYDIKDLWNPCIAFHLRRFSWACWRPLVLPTVVNNKMIWYNI